MGGEGLLSHSAVAADKVKFKCWHAERESNTTSHLFGLQQTVLLCDVTAEFSVISSDMSDNSVIDNLSPAALYELLCLRREIWEEDASGLHGLYRCHAPSTPQGHLSSCDFIYSNNHFTNSDIINKFHPQDGEL